MIHDSRCGYQVEPELLEAAKNEIIDPYRISLLSEGFNNWFAVYTVYKNKHMYRNGSMVRMSGLRVCVVGMRLMHEVWHPVE